MRRLLSWLLKGALAVIPVLITVYALGWLIAGAEGLLAPALRALIGETLYVPGLGLLLVVGFLVATGAALDIYVGRRLFGFFEAVLERLPVVKTVYGAIRDLVRFAVPRDGDELRRVVGYRLGEGAWVIGFVTGPALIDLGVESGDGETDEEWVSVYFPLSYQIGGYTALVRAADLQTLDISVEEAMRKVLTAGVMRS